MPLTLVFMPSEILPTKSSPQVRPAAEGWSQKLGAESALIKDMNDHSRRAAAADG